MKKWFTDELETLKQNNSFRKISDISYKEDKYIVAGDKKYLNLSSNDYLGLSTDSALVKQFTECNKNSKEFFFSSASARLLTGTSDIYRQLEEKLSQKFSKKSALLFNTGYQCNLGIVSAIAKKGDVIFADKLVHASIIAGMQLSQADFYRYKHLDYNHLEELLIKNRNKYSKAFIISESVFSMDGDIADLKKLAELKNKYSCMLMIDEAHAFGVFGNNLCGIAEKNGVLKDIDIIVATFGKAFASAGAFCVADKPIIEYITNKAGSFIFSTALPPVNIMWTKYIIDDCFQTAKAKKEKLENLFKQVHEYIKDDGQSQIIPVMIGDNDKTVKIAKTLQNEGYYVLPIRPPTVPKNTSRLRLSLTADITFEEMKKVFDIINAVR